MMNYQKSMSILLCAAIAASGLTACGNSMAEKDYAAANIASSDAEASQTEIADDKELSIVCTIFPEYDWVKQILGDHAEHAEITYLLDSGVDLHSYQPTALDMAKIAECDLFVYVGGESDEWVEDALADAVNPDMQVINLMEVMGDAAKEEEVKEGMEHDHDHEHGHEEDEHEHDEHDHSKEVSTFEDDEVQDRPLSDWEGDWQSAYPLVLDGSLDEAWEHKSEDGSMTAAEYKDYYTKGYKTDLTAITIDGDHIKFTDKDGKVTESDYKYVGYYIQNWSTGTKAAMYRFEAEDKEAGAPIYIEFNDHIIEPEKAEHFHIRMSNESYDAIVDPEGNWPTFFDAALTPDEVCGEVIGHGHSDEDEDEEHEHEHEDEEHEHEHEDEEHDHDHEHEEGEVEYDEHVWLSLKNAKTFCTEIADKLSILDSANKDDYKANLDAYTAQLDTLDGEFKTLTDGAKQKSLVFGDRFPFRYFVDDYGLDYYAAFVGCSAETEASFETVVFLAEKMDELGCGTIFTIEHSDRKIAQTIIDNTEAKNQKIAEMNSLQSVTKDQLDSGVTYLSLMQANYDTLKGALQ